MELTGQVLARTGVNAVLHSRTLGAERRMLTLFQIQA